MGKESLHGALDARIGFQFGRYVAEGHVHAGVGREGYVLVCKAEGLTCTAAHSDAVHGMAEAFFGHTDKELYGSVGVSYGVVGPYSAERVAEGRVYGGIGRLVEESSDGVYVAEFLLFI